MYWGGGGESKHPVKPQARTKESRRKGIKGTPPGRNALFIMQLEWGFWPQSQSLWDGDPSVLSVLVLSTITSHRPLHKMVDLPTDTGYSV